VTPLAVLIVPLLFGQEYVGAILILQIHIWAFVFVALGIARTKWLLAENFVRFKMVSNVGGAVANIALNLLLIPRYGGVGAAWATLGSYSISAVWSGLLARQIWPSLKQQLLALLLPFRLVSAIRNVRRLL
jgi:polysaccharide transporter, PST family